MAGGRAHDSTLPLDTPFAADIQTSTLEVVPVSTRRVVLSLLAASLALPLAGCPGKGIKIGVVLPLTGHAAVYGTAIQRGIELAHEMSGRTLDGKPVELVVVDSGSDQPAVATSRGFVDISSRVRSGGEQGLLGMAFHPAFPDDPRVYLSYTNASNGLVSRVSEFRTRDDGLTLDPSSEVILLTVAQPAANHNGGHIAFGPDGFLYIGFGDGGSGGDPWGSIGNGQNLRTTTRQAAAHRRQRIERAGPVSHPGRQSVRRQRAVQQRVRHAALPGDLRLRACAIRGAGASIARPVSCGWRRRRGRARGSEPRRSRRQLRLALLRRHQPYNADCGPNAASSLLARRPVRSRGRPVGHRRLRVPRLGDSRARRAVTSSATSSLVASGTSPATRGPRSR